MSSIYGGFLCCGADAYLAVWAAHEKGAGSPERAEAGGGALAALSLWQGIFFMGQCLQSALPYRVYQAGNMSTMKSKSASSEEQESVMGGEYLPVDRNEAFFLSDYVAAYVERLTYDETALIVRDWRREGGAVTVDLENRADSVQQVEVPLLYYKGYRAAADNGEPCRSFPRFLSDFALRAGRVYRQHPGGLSGAAVLERSGAAVCGRHTGGSSV